MTTRIRLALASLALFATLAAPALAEDYATERYRVVEVAGSQTLYMYSGPTQHADVVVELPFDARGLRATGVNQGAWVQVTYINDTREEFTGWAPRATLATDDGYAPTVFRVVDAGAKGVAVRADIGWGAVLGTLPRGANGVLALGACEEGWCPVRYVGKKRRFEGWAPAGNLAVAGTRRSSDDDYAATEDHSGPRLSGDTAEMFAAMRAAANQNTYASKKAGHRGFWWGVMHPREAFNR